MLAQLSCDSWDVTHNVTKGFISQRSVNKCKIVCHSRELGRQTHIFFSTAQETVCNLTW